MGFVAWEFLPVDGGESCGVPGVSGSWGDDDVVDFEFDDALLLGSGEGVEVVAGVAGVEVGGDDRWWHVVGCFVESFTDPRFEFCAGGDVFEV